MSHYMNYRDPEPSDDELEDIEENEPYDDDSWDDGVYENEDLWDG